MVRKFTRNHFTILSLAIASFFINSGNVFATGLAINDSLLNDDFNIRTGSFLLPQAKPAGKYSSAIYLMNVFVPPDWTLDMIKAPMLCYSGKYTLPKNLDVRANFATLFVSTRIDAGLWWNHSHNNFHYGAGYQVAFNYGVLKQFGYHTVLTGWEHQPGIAAGYSFKKMALTVRGDLYITEALNLGEGGYWINYSDNFINGYSITTSLEQRLVKNKVMSIGLKWGYLRYHILAWPAFPVNQNHYDVPEVHLGYNF